ncbi:alpha/beta hydrolase (plasmid) [Pseudonocardia bannensis]|uniref:Alpha/beta hydrolase n=1 Tax=Pseudonocardia bannensis TaxID=630973 RepID=A0A848DHG0_9PSEU|nr:alpha/beta hydrolase fold domain-containing protein [Pseudonocardia bannensis]NMH92118.1 alpha/beta hydrolase [Pseudonocardia bannensis]
MTLRLSGVGPGAPPPGDGAAVELPPELLEFQLTLALPRSGSVRDLLASFDAYINQRLPPVAAVIHQVPVREMAGWRVTADVYRPFGEPPFPTLVYLHGGAWVMGAPSTHRRLAADLAALGLLTIVVDYRRAPRHRFPAAVEDTVHAIDWARDHAAAHGGDPSRLLVGGDSAGANLAAAALATGRAGAVAAALLCYGIYDVHRALPVLADLLGGPDPATQLYLEPEDARRRLDDPRLHPERYCAGFPPTLILAGERDPLFAESAALADRLTAAAVHHEFVVVPGAPHGFLQLPTHPCHAEGLRTIDEFLRRTGVRTVEH